MFTFNIEKSEKKDIFETVNLWDLIIVGAGPAGLNAAIYAKRKGLEVGIVTEDIGGQLHNTSIVDNYLGYTNIEGKDLAKEFNNHAKVLDIPILQGIRVKNIDKVNSLFEVKLSDGKELKTRTLLLTTGGAPRKLQVKGEDVFANKGVSYCTTCDAPFFKDKHVVVAGGGNSAAEAVLDLVPWASKITVVHRSLWRADQILLDKLKNIDKLTVHLNTQILEVIGDFNMKGLKVLDKVKQETYQIDSDGLFIEIGTIPNSYLVKDLVKLNERQEIIVDKNQMTSLEGLYAAGDVTDNQEKQIIISASEGAIASLAITKYLNKFYKGE